MENEMKLVAGFGTVEEYPLYAAAGADELFCGYVPFDWNEKYGNLQPLNRREVRYVDVQIGAFEELCILHKMTEVYKKPVTIALNALCYSGEQYPRILSIVERCVAIGLDSFIVADPALLLEITRSGIPCKIQLSGELGEINTPMLEYFREVHPTRVIFHRKNTIRDMGEIIQKMQGKIPEYEAFFLNEMCHFSGAFCNSLHCDELCHLCQVPYRLGRLDATGESALEISKPRPFSEQEDYGLGASGCGFCALWKLGEAGVTHLKIPGRGNYSGFMEQDIKSARQALNILKESKSEEEYLSRMRQDLFPAGCSRVCYYR